MKEIIHQFTGVALTILAMIALIGVLYGLNQKEGADLKDALKASLLTAEKEGKIAAASKRYAKRKKPTIMYDQEKKLYVGETYRLRECFQAQDADGNKISVRILRVKNADGKTYFEDKNAQDGFCFSKAGKYIITVMAQDTEQVRQIHDIAIAVDASVKKAKME